LVSTVGAEHWDQELSPHAPGSMTARKASVLVAMPRRLVTTTE